MTSIAVLPTRTNADTKFEHYCALVREAEADPALRVSLEHNIKIVRAWTEWRDLFIALDRAC